MILLVEVDARRIVTEHGIKTLLDEFVNVWQNEILVLGLRKLFSKHIEVDSTNVKLTSARKTSVGLSADFIADNLMYGYRKVGGISILATGLQLLVNSDYRILVCNYSPIGYVVTSDEFHEAHNGRAECAESFPDFCSFTHCIGGIFQQWHFCKIGCVHKRLKFKTMFMQKCFCTCNGFEKMSDKLIFINCDVTTIASFSTRSCVIG